MKNYKSFKRDAKRNAGQTASREKTIEKLIDENRERASAFACNLTKSLDEARDLVQEANFRVLRSWNQYDPLRSFSAWYLTIITAISGYFQTAKTAHFKNGVPRNIAISNSCADDTPGTV